MKDEGQDSLVPTINPAKEQWGSSSGPGCIIVQDEVPSEICTTGLNFAFAFGESVSPAVFEIQYILQPAISP